MFHCSRPVLLPPSCAWLAALDVHRSVTWLLGDLMFHCSRPVLLPSPSYACVPSRPARRHSRHVRSLRRRFELVHSNTRGRELRIQFFYSRFLLSWRNGAQAALQGGASDRCLSMYAGVRPPRGVTYSVSIRSTWLAALDEHRSAPGS